MKLLHVTWMASAVVFVILLTGTATGKYVYQE